MKPDQARYLTDLFVPVVENEYRTTVNVIASIPEERKEYRSDPKARTAFELAWHIVASEVWLLDGIISGDFLPGSFAVPPEEVRTIADVLEWYEKSFLSRWEQLKDLSPARLSKIVAFYDVNDYPAVAYLSFLTRHTAHHRGQLSTYLRPMGSKVPSIYGGTADEPWEEPIQGS